MTEIERFRLSQRLLQAALLACVVATGLPLIVDLVGTPRLGLYLFVRQDLPILPLVFAALIARPGARVGDEGRWARIAGSPLLLPAVLIALLLICRLGHGIVFLDRDFSGDEQMATFDGRIFAHGRLAWPLAPGWRGLHRALDNGFILPVAGNAGWVSAYLPVNAAAQALFGRFASPLFVVAGAVALWRIAARLWPGDDAARGVALLLYAGSAQILLTGMTVYAMSGHLALDLVWLALFLRGGKAGHGGAIAIGFLATGLHQPVFHPLFVLPFLGLLAARRDWRTLGVYLVAYAAIGLFWLAWPGWVSAHAAGGIAAHPPGATGFGERAAMLLAKIDPLGAIWVMAFNLVRFATWQHLALLPLAGFGIAATWRSDPMTRALAIGFALPIALCGVLLPYQGQGWGYRYVHGVLGNLCLLGGIGWRAARARGLALGRMLLLTSLASLVLLPVRGWMAWRMAAPYAAVDRAIAARGAPLVVIADDAAPFGPDLVVNRPDLTPPVRLRRSALTPAQFAALCRHVPEMEVVNPAALAPLRAVYGTGILPGVPGALRCR